MRRCSSSCFGPYSKMQRGYGHCRSPVLHMVPVHRMEHLPNIHCAEVGGGRRCMHCCPQGVRPHAPPNLARGHPPTTALQGDGLYVAEW